MSHELLRLRDSLDNQPHLATQAMFETVVKYLDSRNADMAIKAEGTKVAPWQVEVNNGVALLDISGPLTYRATMMEALCGGMSYETLYSRYMAVVEAGASTVVFNMASGGGSALGVFDVATMIRQHATDNNIHLITYVDQMCASACFALGVIADEVITASDSSTGSVGVVIALRNDAEKQKAAGVKTQYIYSGKNKIGKDAEGQFTEEFLSGMQEQCDALYETFVDHVAMYSGMSVEAVKATEAGMYMGQKAVDIGFADKVMSRQEFAAYLNTKEKKGRKKMLSRIFNKGSQAKAEAPQQEEVDMELQAQLEQLQASFEASQADLASMKEQVEVLTSAKEQAEAALAAHVASAAQAKADARKAELAAVVGEAALDATFEAVKGMDDAAYAVILSGFKAGNDAQKQSEMFQEVGTSAEVDLPKADAVKESPEMALLKQKYAQSK